MTIYKKIIFLPVLVIIYLGILFYFDIEQINKTLAGIEISYFFLGAGLWISGLAVRGFRWHLLMKSISTKISFKENLLYYLCGLAMVFSPGRAGEIIRSPFIKRDFGISISKSVSVTLVERYYEIVAVLIIIGVAIFFTDIPKIVIIIPIIITISLVIIIIKKNFFINIIHRLNRIKFIKKFLPDANESIETILSLTTSKFYFKGITTSLIVYLIDSFGIFFILKSLHADIDFMLLLAIFHTSSLIAVMSMIPAGTGVWEGGFIGMLVTNGISNEVAISASLLFRIIITGVFTVIGIFALRLVSNKKK